MVLSDFDIKELNIVETIAVFNHPFCLIIWNDEVNSFEWVISALMDICKHTEEQAEQCTMFIHFQGKYAVKNGEYETLKTMCEAINERGINATIEEVVNR